jgi:hypothetical protein
MRALLTTLTLLAPLHGNALEMRWAATAAALEMRWAATAAPEVCRGGRLSKGMR